MPIMAYSPIEQGRLLGHPALDEVARRHEATPAQIALAWVLRNDGVNAIPRAGTLEHVRENATALQIRLGNEDLASLDSAFPPPTRPPWRCSRFSSSTEQRRVSLAVGFALPVAGTYGRFTGSLPDDSPYATTTLMRDAPPRVDAVLPRRWPTTATRSGIGGPSGFVGKIVCER
jgi:hypothetical protein